MGLHLLARDGKRFLSPSTRPSPTREEIAKALIIL